MSEKGHAKNLEHFKQARDFAISWKQKYAPPNPLIAVTNMNAVADAAETVAGELQAVRTPYRNATAAAEDAFEPLSKLMTRVIKALEISGVPDSVIEDAKTYSRKIQGRRKTPAKKDDPNTPGADESASKHSASQMSRTQRVENLDALNLLLESNSIFAPNEIELQVATLKALAVFLKAKIQAVEAAYIPYSNKLVERNAIYYTAKTGLIYIGRLFKGYAESFGRHSAEWNQVKDLEFEYIGRKK